MNDSFIKSMDLSTIQKKVFTKLLKAIHITRNKITAKKLTALQETRQENLQEKWVYNLSSKPLTSVEKSLLQKGPKFAITLSCTPITDFITENLQNI